MNLKTKADVVTSKSCPVPIIRWSVALLLVGALVCIFSDEAAFRTTEAHVLATWLNPLISGGVTHATTYFLVYLPGSELIAFNITMECTALLLLAPLAIVSALMLMFTRIGLVRVLAALAISGSLTFLINQLRLALIAWTTQTWGMDFGYEIGHRFIGSVIALFSFALGFLVLLWMVFRPERSKGVISRESRTETSGETS
ncbi:archaeosortase/exosortase family protein [Paenarthrobacter sp. NPDC056912]|uniref:archaeosortase/exosortase family protein n=1 Tax=Paenarthrobacter sp. NPDC056912 TaxID=3345965 RepID=UPI00366C91B7